MESERLHPLTMGFAAVRIGRRFVVPALGGGLAASVGDLGRAAVWGLLFLTVPALVSAMARYVSFRYGLTDDELILDSGVLFRRRRVIPVARIQNIETRRSALQRLFGVAELRVETAGGETTEAVLDVLSAPQAEVLRAELLARRRAVQPAGASPDAEEPPVRRLARLSPGDLALAGATANEAGLIAALLAGGIQALQQVPFDLPEPDLRLGPLLAELQLPPSVVVVLGIALLALAFLVLGWIVSIVGAVVGYHDFTLERAGDELRKRYGLLGRREADIPVRRVQAIRVEESLLRRPLGLAVLKVATAGAAPGAGPGEAGRAGSETYVPLARTREVPGLLSAVFPNLDYGALEFQAVHPRARRRAFIRYAAVLLAGVAALGLFVTPRAWWLAALLPAAYLAAHLHYRHLGYALAPAHVVARAGFWNRITWVVPDAKIQTVHLSESPFQRRHGLASLVVDTAAGGGLREARVVDVGRERGMELLHEAAWRAVRPSPV